MTIVFLTPKRHHMASSALVLLVIIIGEIGIAAAAAFSSRGAVSASSQNDTPPPPPMSKIETGAVKRFTAYNKLCKTCPTLLKPRISTLEAMIMGLADDEREQLLSNIALRMEQQQQQDNSYEEMQTMARTAEDVFQFQTGERATSTSQKEVQQSYNDNDRTSQKTPLETPENDIIEDSSSKGVVMIKIVGKMDKNKKKFNQAKLEFSRAQQLLDCTTLFLSGGEQQEMPLFTDSTIYHSIDELRNMTKAELKMQRLKYMAKKAKFEQKLAKYRVKLYKESLKL